MWKNFLVKFHHKSFPCMIHISLRASTSLCMLPHGPASVCIMIWILSKILDPFHPIVSKPAFVQQSFQSFSTEAPSPIQDLEEILLLRLWCLYDGGEFYHSRCHRRQWWWQWQQQQMSWDRVWQMAWLSWQDLMYCEQWAEGVDSEWHDNQPWGELVWGQMNNNQ